MVNKRTSVFKVAEEIEDVRGASVAKVEDDDKRFSNDDFLDIVITRGPSSGKVLNVLNDAGFDIDAVRAPKANKIIIQATR